MIRSIAALSIACVCAGSAQAQGRIEGVLIDSLRTMGPLAGAEVVLLSDGRTAITDRRGRFQFADVPAGSHRVGYAALWLDSIGAPVPMAAANVGTRGRSNVVLATLPRQTAQLAACGTELPSELGLLVGEVRDATSFETVADVIVEARWSERLLGRDVNETREMATVDTSDAAGRYTLCGVPTDVEVTVRSRHRDGRATEPLVVKVDVPMVARDLRVGADDRTVRVRGRVTGPSGEPMPRASVRASLSQAQPIVTDSTGVFAFAIPARSGQLFVRALGYKPTLLPINPVEEELELGDVALSPVDAVLDTVRIVGSRPRTLDELGFEERRRVGLGGFVGDEVLSRLARVNATTVSQEMPPWVRSTGGRYPTFLIRRGIDFCSPRFFVDGYDWGNKIDGLDVDGIMASAKRVEAYKAGFAPPRYNDFNGCGSVVIWTR